MDASGRAGSSATARSTRSSRSVRVSAVERSNRSVAYSISPLSPSCCPSAVNRSVSSKVRSNFEVRVGTTSCAAARPPSRHCGATLFWSTNITWNSGWWLVPRVGFSTSTRYSNGRSWFSYAARLEVLTRASRSVKAGSPEVSVRSTSVLTKKPTLSSTARSARPARTPPRGTSVPAPSLVSRVARAAWSTMNRLTPSSLASFVSRSASAAGTSKGTTSPR